jgi:hypothetical protein
VLKSFFDFMVKQEAAQARAAMLQDEQLLSHPRWSTRQARLDLFMEKPPAMQPWILISAIRPTDIGVTKLTFMLPTDGTSLGHVWAGTVTPAGVEFPRPFGAAKVYQRTPDGGVFTATVETVHNHYSWVRVHHKRQDGQIRETRFFAYRDSFAGTAAADDTGLIATTLGRANLGHFLQIVDRVAKGSPARDVGMNLYRERAIELGQVMLEYFKGNTTLQEAVAAESAVTKRYAQKLESALGADIVNAVQQEVARAQLEMIRTIIK